MRFFSFGQCLKPFSDLIKTFVTRGLGKARIHLCVFVGLAFNGRFKIGLCITDRNACNGITHLCQIIEMPKGMACFTFSGVSKDA